MKNIKGKIVAVLFIVVFVMLVVVICNLLTDKPDDDADISQIRGSTTVTSTDSPVVNSMPEETKPVNTPEPSLLPLPTTEPTPAPTPVPTPEPTPTPEPVKTDLGSGSFKSSSPVALNIIADWSAVAESDTSVAVTVVVSTESYQLHLLPFDSVHMSLGDEFVTCHANEITYDENTLKKNELSSYTFHVDLPAGSSNTYTLQVEWDFKGAYMLTEIETLACGGSITLSR